MTYVALLRGVNVGGNNKLPMKQLAELLLSMGCGEVRTYIQSGNVVFRVQRGTASKWEGEISKQIQAKFGLTVPVVLRTLVEMQGLVSANKFLEEGASVDFLHVVFLSAALEQGVLGQEDEQRFAPETFQAGRRELYLWVPNGLGRSKLAVYLERRLKGAGVTGTTRNWRTTVQLTSMAEELDQA